MRRLAALLATVLAVACHPRDDRDTTPPGLPAILAPVEGDVLGAAELVAGQVVFSGTADAARSSRWRSTARWRRPRSGGQAAPGPSRRR
jgi:hypothetical protein